MFGIIKNVKRSTVGTVILCGGGQVAALALGVAVGTVFGLLAAKLVGLTALLVAVVYGYSLVTD